MVKINAICCPICNGRLKYYDTVKRLIRTKKRSEKYILLQRFRCLECNSIHREIPDKIYPYKQYDAEIIRGVLAGYITSETIGYEDYPCESTMNNWVRNLMN